jgi:hypothetical protein
VSNAAERRMDFSIRRARRTSVSVGLVGGIGLVSLFFYLYFCCNFVAAVVVVVVVIAAACCLPHYTGKLSKRGEETNLPTSKAGEAIGPNSVVIVKIPSKGLSEKGLTTSAETLARTRVAPRDTSARPYSRPKVRESGRITSSSRESRRTPCRSASRMKRRSLLEGSSSFGIVVRCEV